MDAPSGRTIDLAPAWRSGPNRVKAGLFDSARLEVMGASTIGTVRPLAPLPGRGLTVGMRMAF